MMDVELDSFKSQFLICDVAISLALCVVILVISLSKERVMLT